MRLDAGAATWLLAAVVTAADARAQTTGSLRGSVAAALDVLPRAPGATGEPRGATELRLRTTLDGRAAVGSRVTMRVSGWLDALAGERYGQGRRAVTLQPLEISAAVTGRAVDVSAGVGQVVWGRLDEFQPTDVVNPLDVSRFILDGRAQARRSVGYVRTRAYLRRSVSLDVLYVPVFRRGVFDLLHVGTSPFSLAPRQVCLPFQGCVPLSVATKTPPLRWSSGQGGGRVSATTGRVDWSMMAWRGFEALPLYASRTLRVTSANVDSVFPRTTVVGADAETVRGSWGLRGELAWHVRDTVQATDRLAAVPAETLDAGLGLDRRAGDYRVSVTGLLTARRHRGDAVGAIDRRDIQLVTAIDRSFSRDTRRVRVFGVYNLQDRSAFLRSHASWSVRDGVWLEASGGWLRGTSTDTLSRLAERDFLTLGVKAYF